MIDQRIPASTSPGSAFSRGAGTKPDQVTKYQANAFSITLPDGWTDKTVFTLAGPVTDGMQHNVTITVGQESRSPPCVNSPSGRSPRRNKSCKGCRLLKKGNIALANGTAAYQAIFVWFPTDGLKVYQEQIFVLFEGTAYTLTATFSKKTRKTLGPQVERMMLSFEPLKPKPKTQGVTEVIMPLSDKTEISSAPPVIGPRFTAEKQSKPGTVSSTISGSGAGTNAISGLRIPGSVQIMRRYSGRMASGGSGTWRAGTGRIWMAPA